jgi:Protein of unknown function (DUF3830)
MSGARLRLAIGPYSLSAHLEAQSAPKSCEALMSLLPLRKSLLHVRWSGESGWAPLGPVPFALEAEAPIHRPTPGQILLYAGEISEPELLVAYGVTAFACKDGPLSGNHVITIDDGADVLPQIGQDLLWRGALPIEIELA